MLAGEAGASPARTVLVLAKYPVNRRCYWEVMMIRGMEGPGISKLGAVIGLDS